MIAITLFLIIFVLISDWRWAISMPQTTPSLSLSESSAVISSGLSSVGSVATNARTAAGEGQGPGGEGGFGVAEGRGHAWGEHQ